MASRSLALCRFALRVCSAVCMLLLLLRVSAAPVHALGGQTGNLHGHVVDAATNMPVAGAAIGAASPNGTFHAKSDAKGDFSLLGLPVDTYTVSIEAPGYQTQAAAGITIIGDQTLNLAATRLSKALRTIGSVTARSVASAFQPNQTVDSVTISGARIEQSTGRAGNTDEKALLLAAPGVTLSDAGNVSIRGGLSTEVGFQFDGVPFTDPFNSSSGSTGGSVLSPSVPTSNAGSPLLFSGLSSVQVVEGAGDATQGNVGGGVVNLVPKRGTNPPFGYVDVAAGGPNFNHQLAMQYGFATPNGRFSDFVSYSGGRSVPYFGYSNSDTAGLGNFYGKAYRTNDDFVNNFVAKVGNNNTQTLQVLFQSHLSQQYGFAGGTTGQLAYPFDPASYLNGEPTGAINGLATGYGCGTAANLTCTFGPGIGLPAAIAAYQHLVGLTPNVPNLPNGAYTGGVPKQLNNTNFLKFEYDNNLSPNDFLAVRYYNWTTSNITSSDLPEPAGNTEPTYIPAGGQRAGINGEFTHQFGPKHTVTLGFGYENQVPIDDSQSPTNLFVSAGGPPGGGAPSIADFLEPVNGVCPIVGGCYLAKYFPNGIPRVPVGGINYHGSTIQVYNASFRDQWSPNARWKVDWGFRFDGASYNIAPNPVNAGLPFYSSNPSDVNPNSLKPAYLQPKTTEPRFAATYQMGRNDSIRAGYGRSVIFLNGSTFGTPGALYGYAPFAKVPALDSAANPGCGSAGTATNPSGGLYRCRNYAQQLFWAWDNGYDFPDYGNFARSSTYNNYDLTYQHQFMNGWGLRATPFFKLGTDLPGFSVISLQTNPTTGQISSETFSVNNINVNKTTGFELGLTTPDRPYGFSGFLSSTYQNVLDRVSPLVGGEDSVPFDLSTALLLGDTFRAAYVSPFTTRVGVEYKLRSGLRINPILNYNRGYPFSAGNLTPSYSPCGLVANVPQVNFGCGATVIPSAINGGTASGATSTQYVDPALPGNTFNPNIAATRGTPQTAAAGGVLSKPNLVADLDIEQKLGKRGAVGIYVQNIFGNVYNGAIPLLNPFYQPVATGIAGPQTGQNAFANPAYTNAGTVPAGTFLNHGNANIPASAYGTAPYVLLPVAPTQFTLYYQLAL
jgi:Carboxypeptidase regulatory-like domain